MIDHRGVQRALFRMQLDPDFAAALRSGDRDALADTGLGTRELGWLRAADPAAVSADRDGQRRDQFLRNVSSEWPLTRARLGAARLAGFASAPELHEAVRADASLPLAFGAWALRVAADERTRAFAALEQALCRARRAPWTAQQAGAGFRRSAGSVVLKLPAGTLAAAEAALAPAAARPPHAASDASEAVLVHPAADPPPAHGLREARAEGISEAVAALFEAAADGLDEAGLVGFAARFDADPADLRALCGDYANDGALESWSPTAL